MRTKGKKTERKVQEIVRFEDERKGIMKGNIEKNEKRGEKTIEEDENEKK